MSFFIVNSFSTDCSFTNPPLTPSLCISLYPTWFCLSFILFVLSNPVPLFLPSSFFKSYCLIPFTSSSFSCFARPDCSISSLIPPSLVPHLFTSRPTWCFISCFAIILPLDLQHHILSPCRTLIPPFPTISSLHLDPYQQNTLLFLSITHLLYRFSLFSGSIEEHQSGIELLATSVSPEAKTQVKHKY